MDTASRVYVWQAIAVGLFVLPIVLACIFTLAWRRSLARPWSFLILGACVLYVLYFFIGELVFTPAVDAYIFVPTPGTARAAEKTTMTPFFMELLPTPVTLIVVTFPVLWWIRSLLRKPKSGAAQA
jgi:hypothetical protein